MKRKILTLCLVLVLAVTAIGGATLAYFTDTDSKTNTFTVGKVDITLNDEFEQRSKLLPAIGDGEGGAVTDDDGKYLNAVDKIVSVTNNDGSEDAYVRVHIAVPSSLAELLILSATSDTAGQNWYDGQDTVVSYTTEIDGVAYNVTCQTYSKKLAAGEKTTNVLEWVALASNATSEDMEAIQNGFNIIVLAEGVQATGFSDAYTALEEAFGTPDATENPWNNYGITTE